MDSFIGSSPQQCNLQNIKSLIIISRIFNNLEKLKFFKIIKYNKKTQKKFKISLDDYKEIFSIIEIEITPAEKKYGNFINIYNEEERKYYHIYFDNDNNEKHRYYLNDDDNVRIIKIKIDRQVKSFRNLFNSAKCIERIDFKKFYRTNIIDMNSMFHECESLKIINFLSINTDNVKDMSGMFTGCSSLEELNLSNFNTNNVTDINGMFSRCSSLEKIIFSNFHTNKVTNMSFLFKGCS